MKVAKPRIHWDLGRERRDGRQNESAFSERAGKAEALPLDGSSAESGRWVTY